MSAEDGFRDYDPIQPRGTDWRGFFRRAFGQAIHPLRHFHQTLFTLALFAAGRRHLDAQCLGAIEQRSSGFGFALLQIKM